MKTLINPVHARQSTDWLLELMEQLKFVSPRQIEEARTEAKPGQSIMSALLEKQFITHAQIATAKGAQFGAQVVMLRDLVISPEAIKMIKPSVAWCHGIIPFENNENRMVIAIEDPSDLNTIDTLTHLLDTEIDICVAASDDMAEALRKYYPDGEEAGRKLREELEANRHQ